MRFLVDGYNVTRTDPATTGLGAAEQRAELGRRLAARGRDLLGAGAIVLVWDGLSDGHGAAPGAVEEWYSGSASADDLIVRRCGPGDVVVTADRALADAVRAKGAEVRAPAGVFAAAAPVRRRRARRGRSGQDDLPPGAHRITEELKRLWLAGDETDRE
jgi:hypothetical protein